MLKHNLSKERLDSKLSGWKSKNLSWSGRATLIKSMAQAIPAYAMSTIQLPKVSNLTSQLADFGGILKLSSVHTGPQYLGLLFVGPKRREAWVSGISGTSTKLSSPNLASGF